MSITKALKARLAERDRIVNEKMCRELKRAIEFNHNRKRQTASAWNDKAGGTSTQQMTLGST